VSQLLAALTSVQHEWAASQFTGSYADAKDHSATFSAYKQTTKRTWVAEKQDIATLFGNVQTKLKTYGLRLYVPPMGLALSDLDAAWTALLASEAKRSRSINAQIREYALVLICYKGLAKGFTESRNHCELSLPSSRIILHRVFETFQLNWQQLTDHLRLGIVYK
jgi:hypothetical protein